LASGFPTKSGSLLPTKRGRELPTLTVQMIETYIHYYNTRRVQRKLGVLTPME